MLKTDYTFQTLLAGFKVQPTEVFEIGLDLAWNKAEGSLDPFRFLEGEEWSAAKPNQWYDFSRTHTYSDLDTTFFEAALDARYQFNSRAFLSLGYRYLDFQDDAPVLYDTSGKVQFYRAGLGMNF